MNLESSMASAVRTDVFVRKIGHFTHDTLQNQPFVRKTALFTHERCENDIIFVSNPAKPR